MAVNTDFIEIPIFDDVVKAKVIYEYMPAIPAVTSGVTESWDEGESETFDLISLCIINESEEIFPADFIIYEYEDEVKEALREVWNE